MPTRAAAEAFAALMENGKYVEAIKTYYLENATIQENNDEVLQGRDFLAAREAKILAGVEQIAATRLSPSLIDGDTVITKWRFDVTMKDGTVRTLEEVTWQTWVGEKIASERFYFDPAQRAAA